MSLRLLLTLRRNRHQIECPRPELELRVRTENQEGIGWELVKFVVDTGADVTCIPIRIAQELGIHFERSQEPLPVHSHGARSIGHRGQFLAQVGSEVFTWTCYFIEPVPAPNGQSATNAAQPVRQTPPRTPRTLQAWQTAQFENNSTCLLGRAEVLSRDFDFSMDATHFSLTRRNATRSTTESFWKRLCSRVLWLLKRED